MTLLIGILIGVALTVTAGWVVVDILTREPPARHGNLAPRYYGYRGGWASVTVCDGCGLRGLREDAHPVEPCGECGGKRRERVGRWITDEGLWEVREEVEA